MKIASWNVNGIRARIEHITAWIKSNQPDVLALQETKVMDDMFPFEAFTSLGYEAMIYGQKSYNGVALLSKKPPKECTKGIDDFIDEQTRVISGIYEGVKIIDVYIPNGQSVGSEKFEYKMRWLKNLHRYLEASIKINERIVILGDFNIAPQDIDVHDPIVWKDKVLCSDEEREWLSKIENIGFIDSFRLFDQEEGLFSWWDYRMASYRRKMGMRIDLILVSEALRKNCIKSYIDEAPRALERPSDHTPVLVELSL
ncbi:MAG: exodeoxyribonuclease III [Gammaproteobacteria bacterium]|jgi:exodeoxyribonuclease-3|nr:exodeoxyribonuclease III [Gammaproteobacteria bacterium]|tara:strand:+ start:62 stop:829 length:768 start_codon:yes stop_codon:yes gene_type:complete